MKRRPRPFPWVCGVCGVVGVFQVSVASTERVEYMGVVYELVISELRVLGCRGCGGVWYCGDSLDQVGDVLGRLVGVFDPVFTLCPRVGVGVYGVCTGG